MSGLGPSPDTTDPDPTPEERLSEEEPPYVDRLEAMVLDLLAALAAERERREQAEAWVRRLNAGLDKDPNFDCGEALQQAEAEVERLRAVESLLSATEDQRDSVYKDALEGSEWELGEAIARSERLVEALRDYGHHRPRCEQQGPFSCRCGYSAALTDPPESGTDALLAVVRAAEALDARDHAVNICGCERCAALADALDAWRERGGDSKA